MNKKQIKNFWKKVDKNGPNGCWLWTGAKTSVGGYGNFGVNYKLMKAHRVSWFIHFGEPINNLCVLHKCDNPPCVNPDHLWLGTMQDNMQDKVKKGRLYTGDRSGLVKLSPKQVLQIRYDRSCGLKLKELSLKYGVTMGTISTISNKKTRKNV